MFSYNSIARYGSAHLDSRNPEPFLMGVAALGTC
jgi:hypothetical protein